MSNPFGVNPGEPPLRWAWPQMPQLQREARSDGSPPSRTLAQQAGGSNSPLVIVPEAGSSTARNPPPLVIVSERGRHSEASRRIVRAQAARASAAQSRETRARNREDRTGVKESPWPSTKIKNAYGPLPSPPTPKPRPAPPPRPLVNWITNTLQLSADSHDASGVASPPATSPPPASRSHSEDAAYAVYSPGSMPAVEAFSPSLWSLSNDKLSRRLPMAIPRGFARLQQYLQISDAFLAIISRTACFDFASPGAQDRLDRLLFDIVVASATVASGSNNGNNGSNGGGGGSGGGGGGGGGVSGSSSNSNSNADAQLRSTQSIQTYLRIACTCLTIFQAQRTDGPALQLDSRYASGLEAALAEAVILDQAALREPNAAQAALWAVFTISVTTGEAVTIFDSVLCALMADMQLVYWEQVRSILLEFIYPGTCLDEPGRLLFDRLSR